MFPPLNNQSVFPLTTFIAFFIALVFFQGEPSCNIGTKSTFFFSFLQKSDERFKVRLHADLLKTSHLIEAFAQSCVFTYL